MTAVTWTESFATVDTEIWKNQWGILPVAIGGGKIKFQKVAGDSCHMSRAPFGVEGSLAARSVCVAFTVYPDESTAAWYLTAGNRQGTWPYCEPHANPSGFTFIDSTTRLYAGSKSNYYNAGDIQYPQAPFEVRVGTYLDPGAKLIYNTMTIDGVVVLDDVSQSSSISWETYPSILGYQLPYFNLSVGDNVKAVVIGNMYGIYGGTRAENAAWVKAATASTMAPTSELTGASLALDSLSNLPILYSRDPADIPRHIAYGASVGSLAADLYTAPFPVVDGETIYAATVVGNGGNPSTGASGGFVLTPPKAITVAFPPALTIPVAKTWIR